MRERRPAEVFSPGEFIREELEERGWTQDDLAEILGRTPAAVNEVITGKRGITPETAKGLGDAFGTGPELWLNLDAVYQLSKVPDGGDTIARRAKIYSKAPIKDMIRRHWLEPSHNVYVLEKRVLDFLKINNLNEEPRPLAHAARKSTSYDTVTQAQNAWLLRARQLAEAVHVEKFTEARLNDAFEKLRNLLQASQEVRHVPHILSESGIRLVVVEPLPQTRIDGSCLWLDLQSPIVVLSVRFDRIDYFWYTLVHELAHVKNRHGQDNGILDVDYPIAEQDISGGKPAPEEVADRFAAEYLVPQAKLENFIARVRPMYSKMKIQGFAKVLGVHPGIIVGQLQHRGEISYAHNRDLLEINKVRSLITAVALTDGWGQTLPPAF